MEQSIWMREFHTGEISGTDWSKDEGLVRAAHESDVADGLAAARLVRIAVELAEFDESPPDDVPPRTSGVHSLDDAVQEVSDNLRWDAEAYAGRGFEATVVASRVSPAFLAGCGY